MDHAAKYVDGGRGGSGAEFMNHSCAPNLVTRRIGRALVLVQPTEDPSRRRTDLELPLSNQGEAHSVPLWRTPCRGTLRYCVGLRVAARSWLGNGRRLICSAAKRLTAPEIRAGEELTVKYRYQVKV